MRYIYMLPAAFFVPIIHEWVKAIISNAQGDPTPRNSGYLTANPFKYFEPIGFAFMLHFGFGWGRPTPTAALHYKDRNRGVLVTYLAPVIVSFILGLLAVVGVALFTASIYGPTGVEIFFNMLRFPVWVPNLYLVGLIMLSHFAFMSINFALFNLLPVYPMAANKLILQFSRPDTIARINHYEKPMQVVLILMLAIGVVGSIIIPITNRIIIMTWALVT